MYLKVTVRSDSSGWTRASGESHPSKVVILNTSAAIVTAASMGRTESTLLIRCNELGLSSIHASWTLASQFRLSLFRVFTFTITLQFKQIFNSYQLLKYHLIVSKSLKQSKRSGQMANISHRIASSRLNSKV